MKKISIYTILLCSLVCGSIQASPKREFRSTWLTTVWAIDWPSIRGSSADAERSQKNELNRILDSYEELGLNACFFQVRGMSDAFYNSAYEPWSQYLTGTRGLAPTYDPLQYLIDEAHKRGIEVHAWMNPYRYATSTDNYGTLATDYANTHPEWLIKGADAYILNPGIPEVRQQIVRVVEDVVSKYDVDGIVFDDYFYLNGSTYDATDSAQYRLYNPDNLSRGDWRRQNINKMVSDVYSAIKALKPWVRFGIGPAGVAASSQAVADKYGITACPAGSDWQYNGIYAEPVQWLMDRTIDYISPQVYWTIGSSNDYAKIVPWWASVANKFGRHNYVSASLSNLTAVVPGRNGMTEHEKARVAAKVNYLPSETVNEIRINYSSAKEGAPGMVFYSSRQIQTSGFIDTVTYNVWDRPAIVPSITWQAPTDQTLVSNLTLTGSTLSWQYSGDVRYAIYALPTALRHDHHALTTTDYLLGLTYSKSYTLPSGIGSGSHSIAVVVIDRYGNEFAPRFLGEAEVQGVAPTLLSPSNGDSLLLPCDLSWQAMADAMSYTVEIATDANFSSIVAVAQADSNVFSTQPFVDIDGSATYYWRVRGNVANAVGVWSETRSMNGALFSVTSPRDGEGDVDEAPTITWTNAGAGVSYTIEIATNSDFLARNIVYTATSQQPQHTLPQNVLLYGTTYYVRVQATSINVNVTSAPVVFTTKMVTMLPPVVISPVSGAHISGASITATVDITANNGFLWELSETAAFPRTRFVDETEPNVYSYTFTEDLRDGDYWLRVATVTADDYTDYSGTVHFTYSQSTGVDNVEKTDVYVSNNRLYAPAGTVWSLYTLTGVRLGGGTAQAGVTHLPILPKGVYIIQTDSETIKYTNQ